MSATDDGQAQGSLLLLLNCLGAACAWGGRLVLPPLDASKLFGIREDKVHVLETMSAYAFYSHDNVAYLIEREHLASHRPPIVEGDAHPPVNLIPLS